MSRSFRMAAAAFAVVFALVSAPASAAGKTSRAKGPRSHSLVGTLQKVDGQQLTIQTAKGSETVMLASTASIREGGKAVQASQLATETGARVKVRYAETNGQRQANLVTVVPARTAKQASRASAATTRSKTSSGSGKTTAKK